MKIYINQIKPFQTVVVLNNEQKFLVEDVKVMDNYTSNNRYNLLLADYKNRNNKIIVNWFFPVIINEGSFKEQNSKNDFFLKEVIQLERNLQEPEKRRPLINRGILGNVDYLGVIRKGLKTTIQYRENDQIKYMTVKYDGQIGDKGHSYLKGFLWAVYKLAHRNLSSNAFQTKIGLYLSGLKPKEEEMYLKAFFLESGLLSPTKAIDVLVEQEMVDDGLKMLDADLKERKPKRGDK